MAGGEMMTMPDLSMSALWTASAVVLGFQLNALSWRIQRELQMEMRRERTWVTIADGILWLSLLILACGVFVAPVILGADLEVATVFFGWSIILLVSAPAVLAGHYDLLPMLPKKRPRPRVTIQELLALIVPVAFTVIYWVAVYLGSRTV